MASKDESRAMLSPPHSASAPHTASARHEPGVSRRAFLRSSAAAACLLPGAFGRSAWAIPSGMAARPTAPSERITMGVIGCGSMGRANLNGFLQFDDVQVVAVCDPDEDRRKTACETVDARYAERTRSSRSVGCATYADFRELLDRRDIDTIVQATPDHWHAPVVIAAAQAGKDIYGENPLGLTIRHVLGASEKTESSIDGLA